MSSLRIAACVATAALFCTAPAQAGDWVDARLTLSVCNDDLAREDFRSTDTAPRRSVAFGCRTRAFFDDYDAVRSGFDSSVELLLHRGFGAPDAALHVDFGLGVRLPSERLLGRDSVWAGDDASFLRLRWTPSGWTTDDGVAVVLFPLSSDRLRLGFSRRISWGGEAIFQDAYWTPAAAVVLECGDVHGFLSLKSAQHGGQAFIGGLSAAVGPHLQVEAKTGLVDHGLAVTPFSTPRQMRTIGGSLQATYARGGAVPPPLGLGLNVDDPQRPGRLFQREAVPGGLSWRLSSEVSLFEIADVPGSPAAPRDSEGRLGFAGDLQLQLTYDRLRVQATGMVRNAAFLTLNATGRPPFDRETPQPNGWPEVLAFGTAEYHLPQLRLTPGLSFAALRPITTLLGTASSIFPTPGAGVSHTSSLLESTEHPGQPVTEALATDCGTDGTQACLARFTLTAKVFCRVDLLDWLVGMVELYGTYDRNRVVFVPVDMVSQTPKRVPFFDVVFNAALSAGF